MHPVTSSSSIGAPGAGVPPASAAGAAPATGPSFDDVFRQLSGGDLHDAVTGAVESRAQGAGHASGPAPDARDTGLGEGTEPGAPAPLATITVAVDLVLPPVPETQMAVPPDGATIPGDGAPPAAWAHAEPPSAASRSGSVAPAGSRAPVFAIDDALAPAAAMAGTGASAGAAGAAAITGDITTTTTPTTSTTSIAAHAASSFSAASSAAATAAAASPASASATAAPTAAVPARADLPVQGHGEHAGAVTASSGGSASEAGTAADTDPSAPTVALSGRPAFHDVGLTVSAGTGEDRSLRAGSTEARPAGRGARWSNAPVSASTPPADASAPPGAPAPVPEPAAAAAEFTANAHAATRHAAALWAPLLGAPARNPGQALAATGAPAQVADAGTANGARPPALDTAAAAHAAHIIAGAGIDSATTSALPDEVASLVAAALRGQHPATSAALRAFKQAGGAVPGDALPAALANVASASAPALTARVSDLAGAAADGVAPGAASAAEPERRLPVMPTLLAPAPGAELRVASDLGAGRVADADRTRNAPVDGESVHAQIVQSLRVQWAGGSGEARVTLRPGYLGEVTATIKVDQGTVTATLQADTPEVRRWMEANTQTLRDALLEHGLKLDRLVVAEPSRGQAADDRQGRPRGRSHPDPQPRQRRPRDDDADATFDLNP